MSEVNLTSTPRGLEPGAAPGVVAVGLSPLLRGGRGFWLAVAVLGAIFLAGLLSAASLWQAGIAHRAPWGYYAAAFSLLLSTAGAAPLVSAGLRFTGAHWRRPVARASELFAVAGLLTLAWFWPLLRLVPASQPRASLWFGWPGAPHLWDTLIIAGLTLCGLALLYVGAIPDFAAARDEGSRGRRLFALLALSWQGGERQWRALRVALMALGACYILAFVLAQTLISTDFAQSLVPGWKDSLFPAYNVVSGLQGGLAALMVALFLVRRLGGLEDFIGREQFWALGKLLLALCLLWFYFWWSGFIVLWYGRRPIEELALQLFTVGPYLWAFLPAFVLNFLAPFFVLLWNGARRSILGPALAALLVLAGMLFDRIRLYVAAFSVEEAGPILEALPAPRLPQAGDWLVLAGAVAGVALLYLLATRLVPSLSLWEVAEGEQLRVERAFLRRKVTVIAKPD